MYTLHIEIHKYVCQCEYIYVCRSLCAACVEVHVHVCACKYMLKLGHIIKCYPKIEVDHREVLVHKGQANAGAVVVDVKGPLPRGVRPDQTSPAHCTREVYDLIDSEFTQRSQVKSMYCIHPEKLSRVKAMRHPWRVQCKARLATQVAFAAFGVASQRQEPTRNSMSQVTSLNRSAT